MRTSEVILLVSFLLFIECGCRGSASESSDANHAPAMGTTRREEPVPKETGETKITIPKAVSKPTMVPPSATPSQEAEVAPEPLYSPVPGLLEAAKGCNKYSRPVVRILVGKDGSVVDVTFVRSTGCSDANKRLMEHLQTWRFTPGSRNGVPVEAEYVVGINLGG